MRAAYIGHCRPDEHQPCMVPDVFRGTDPLPVHPGGLVRVNTKRRARHVRVEADCGARKPKRRSRTSWSFRIRGTECTHATIEVVYRTTWARYTVSLEDHVHTGASDQ